MRKAIAAAIILMCLASTAEADRILTQGAGTTTCGKFDETYAKNPLTAVDTELFAFSWAQGWMAAMNIVLVGVAGEDAYTDLGAISPKDQMAHIRDFCSNNPLKLYDDAVEELYDSMREAQGLRGWIKTLKGL